MAMQWMSTQSEAFLNNKISNAIQKSILKTYCKSHCNEKLKSSLPIRNSHICIFSFANG